MHKLLTSNDIDAARQGVAVGSYVASVKTIDASREGRCGLHGLYGCGAGIHYLHFVEEETFARCEGNLEAAVGLNGGCAVSPVALTDGEDRRGDGSVVSLHQQTGTVATTIPGTCLEGECGCAVERDSGGGGNACKTTCTEACTFAGRE